MALDEPDGPDDISRRRTVQPKNVRRLLLTTERDDNLSSATNQDMHVRRGMLAWRRIESHHQVAIAQDYRHEKITEQLGFV